MNENRFLKVIADTPADAEYISVNQICWIGKNGDKSKIVMSNGYTVVIKFPSYDELVALLTDSSLTKLPDSSNG